MRPDPTCPLDPRAITLWRFGGALRTVFLGLMVLVATGPLAYVSPQTWPLALLGLVLLLAYGCVSVIFAPKLRWRYWRYQLDEHEVELKRGFVVVRRTLIPLVRVQHVDTVQGPLARYFGLSSVTLSTAAGTHEIPALADAAADALRNQISTLARQAQEPL